MGSVHIAEICSEVGRTIPGPSLAKEGNPRCKLFADPTDFDVTLQIEPTPMTFPQNWPRIAFRNSEYLLESRVLWR